MARVNIPLHLRVASQLAVRPVYRWMEAIRERKGQGFILAFHSINPGDFEKLVDALVPATPAPLDEIVERTYRKQSTAGMFSITVDDGVADSTRALADVARRRQWPITFYLPTAYLEGEQPMPFQLWAEIRDSLPLGVIDTRQFRLDLSSTNRREMFRKQIHKSMRSRPRAEYAELVENLARYLKEAEGIQIRVPAPISWREVAQMSAEPLFSFGSHGVSHTAVSALNGTELEREFHESREVIAQHTGRECRHFCYPYGSPESIGADAPAMAARFYRSAATMCRGHLNGAEPYLLPRIPLYQRDTPALARLKVLTA